MDDLKAVSSRSKRRFGYLTALILILIGAVSAGWYWAAGKLDQSVIAVKSYFELAGKKFECANHEVRGYPFRIGVFCDRIRFDDPGKGVTITGNEFRSAAQLYKPGHVVAEIDGPFDVSVPGLAPLFINWENLKSSAVGGLSGFERMSVVVDDLTVSANDFGVKDLLGSIEQLQFHARQVSENTGLEVALSAQQWLVDDGGSGTIQPIAISLDAEMQGLLDYLHQQKDILEEIKLNGAKGFLRNLSITTKDGGNLIVSGPIEINRNGLLSGQLNVDLDDPNKLVGYASSVFPPAGEALGNMTQYLEAFARTNGGKVQIRDFKISIKEGKIILGFFEVGTIPALFQ